MKCEIIEQLRNIQNHEYRKWGALSGKCLVGKRRTIFGWSSLSANRKKWNALVSVLKKIRGYMQEMAKNKVSIKTKRGVCILS